MLKSVLNVLMVPVLGFAFLIAVAQADVGGIGDNAPQSSLCDDDSNLCVGRGHPPGHPGGGTPATCSPTGVTNPCSPKPGSNVSSCSCKQKPQQSDQCHCHALL